MDDLARITAALERTYRIERELGSGGMATVYLAHDLRHERRVALKVLRPELAVVIGAERFLAEIKTTANLQHPHILSLFDSGEAGGLVYYVMPYVDGESLRDRLNREKQLPVDQAIQIAREVLDALEYAHAKGIVHRDIKPENILLHGGHAMVADFGIALAASRSNDATRMTETGMSLGTPHYMAPEQAMGERDITARADIYALGCVLYEMLVAEPPFQGPTAQAIIARVMTEEPRSLTLQRRTIPPHVEAAVVTSLAKLPADRFASAAQFAAALGNTGYASTTTVARAYSPAKTRRGQVMAAAPWALLAVIGGLVAWSRFNVRPVDPLPVVRVGLELPAGALWEDQTGTGMALSPDGTLLAYNGRDSTNGHLFLRYMDRMNPVAISGTAGALHPSFSLDGRWLGFMIQDKIYRVPAAGGTPEVICTNGSLVHYAWFDSRSVIVGDTSGLRLCTMDAGSTPLIRPDSNDQFLWPQTLPDRRGVLYTIRHGTNLTLGLYDVARRTGRSLGIIGTNARYVSPGYLMYATLDGVIRTVPFDLKHLKVTGEPTVIVQGARVGAGGAAKMAVSSSGVMVMAPGQSGERVLELLDRRGGGVIRLPAPSGPYNFPRFSPDGRQVAVVLGDVESTIWLFDRSQGTLTRLTFDSGASRPTWTSDGRRIVYSRIRGLTADLRVIDADGSTAAESLLSVPGVQMFQTLFTPDGRSMLVRTTSSTGRDVWRVSLDSSAAGLRPLLTTPSDERGITLSPDGRWMAYVSDESGRQEVYVRAYPGMQGRRQVSLQGGLEPVWSQRGDEILYRNGPAFLSATVRTSPQFEVVSRQTLFTNPDYAVNAYEPNYDLSADGQRLVVVRGIGRSGGLSITLNWFENLRAGRVGSTAGSSRE